MSKTELILGDCLEKLKDIPENSVDSVVTDPPYELGFMGKAWDSTGISNNPLMWAECLRVLKPGGHLLAFSGTRTYHRMACAIEDGGFEIRDMIEWVYGSGFPKSLSVGKAVDKLLGNEREYVSGTPKPIEYSGKFDQRSSECRTITKGTSPFEGYGTALKPAHEPICLARKPLSEKTVAENCLKWGTGGLDIDGSRVGTETIHSNGFCAGLQKNCKEQGARPYVKGLPGTGYEGNDHIGRFPANLIHDNSDEVRGCFPETKSGAMTKAYKYTNNGYSLGKPTGETKTICESSSGNASRFFKSILYTAKASKSERGVGNTHPTVKPVALLEYLINMITPKCGTVLDPFMGSGSTGVACKRLYREFIGIELNQEYITIAEKRIKNTEVNREMF